MLRVVFVLEMVLSLS